ncbi:MAG: PilZ domain-containing protein [Salinarimonas sp.]
MPREYRPFWIDKRAEVRLPLYLSGVLLVGDGTPMLVESTDVSLTGMAITANLREPLGTPCLGEFEEIGRVRGHIVRWLPDGFAIAFDHDPARQAALAEDLDRLEATRARCEIGARRPPPDPRELDLVRAARLPAPDVYLEIELPDQRIVMERLRDVSTSGARVLSDERPPIGSALRVQTLTARVVRHTNDGFAVSFG